MILTLLRERTRPLHDRVAGRLDVLSHTRSLDRYQYLLQRLYGLYVPMEQVLVPMTAGSRIPGIDYRERRKAPHIAHDLRAIAKQVRLEELPLCSSLPPLNTPEQIVGCLYVLESATLEGQVISRQLRESLGIAAEDGAAFYSGYGSETGRQWKAFGAAATVFAATCPSYEPILASACATLECFEQWFLPLQQTIYR
ncbi:MAG: biliverdin-producing heme oxygenase [Armatimonadota bacterium]